LANASIAMTAAEDFTPTAQGTYIRFHTTRVGTTTAEEKMRIQANGNVGMGTTNPAADLEVSRDGSPTTIVATSYGDVAAYSARTSLGSAAAPAAVTTNTALAMFGGRGHTGSAFASSLPTGSNVSITMHAAENFTPTATGTDIRFWTTPVGSTGAVEAMRVTPKGNLGIGVIADAALHVMTQSAGSGNNTAAFSAPTIGGNQSHIHYGTTGDWIIRSASSSGTVIMQDSGGKVGIGTTTPTAKLTVIGSQATGVFNASYLSFNGGSFAAVGHGAHNMSIYADNDIMGLGFYALSDERIKNIRGQSDGSADLRTLRDIQITDYRFKDEIGQGSGQQKKVIAQQVEKVFPQAVNQHTGVVPDIFKKAAIQDGWVVLKSEVKKGDRVRLISEKHDAIHEVLEVKKDSFRTNFKGEGKEVFVYGREVKDVRAVDYEAISMLNVSATQELARRLEAKDAEIVTLKKQLLDQAAAMKTLAAKLAARDEALEARLAKLEQAAKSNAVKVAMKK
jgi:hypothetical protein